MNSRRFTITSSAVASNGKGTMPSAFVVLRFIISNFCGPLLTTARLSSFRPPQADGMDGLRLCDEDRNLTFCAHLIIRIRRVCRHG